MRSWRHLIFTQNAEDQHFLSAACFLRPPHQPTRMATEASWRLYARFSHVGSRRVGLGRPGGRDAPLLRALDFRSPRAWLIFNRRRRQPETPPFCERRG